MLNRPSSIGLALTMALVYSACDPGSDGHSVPAFSDLFAQESVVHLVTSADDPLGGSGDIVIWNGRLAISDPLAKNVKVFDPDGALWATIGRLGDGPGEFRYPSSLVVDDRGFLAVLDELSGTVSFFGPDGAFRDAFRFNGAFTGGMAGAFQGTKLLIGTWLMDQDGQHASDHVAHLFDNAGNLESSFGHRAVAEERAETAFMGMQVTVVDDSLVAWGTVGRRTIYIQSLGASVDGTTATDSVQMEGLAPLDWSRAPSDDMELFQWVTDYELLTGILSLPGIAVARFQGGDARKGEEWYRYGLISLAEKRVIGMTDRTRSRLHLISGGAALGISIEDDGEAYLTRYRLTDAVSPAL